MRRGGQIGCTAQGDLAARKQTVQMGHMPVMQFGRQHVPILQPFLKLARRANLKWGEPGARGGDLVAKLRIDIQDLPARMVFANRSRRISMSMVGPAHMLVPFGCRFSGESEGHVTSQ